MKKKEDTIPQWAVDMEQRLEQKIEDKILDIRPPWVDKMLELLDIAAGNYKKVDEAQELLSGRQSEQEERITKIETHLHL